MVEWRYFWVLVYTDCHFCFIAPYIFFNELRAREVTRHVVGAGRKRRSFSLHGEACVDEAAGEQAALRNSSDGIRKALSPRFVRQNYCFDSSSRFVLAVVRCFVLFLLTPTTPGKIFLALEDSYLCENLNKRNASSMVQLGKKSAIVFWSCASAKTDTRKCEMISAA